MLLNFQIVGKFKWPSWRTVIWSIYIIEDLTFKYVKKGNTGIEICILQSSKVIALNNLTIWLTIVKTKLLTYQNRTGNFIYLFCFTKQYLKIAKIWACCKADIRWHLQFFFCIAASLFDHRFWCISKRNFTTFEKSPGQQLFI